jgi:nucleotide-binding universal stress UspA family protein
MGHQAILEHLRTRGEDVIGAARKALDAAGIRNEARVEIAPDPATEIARVAGEARCDQIVMGTRGLGALAGLALGSVATKVLHLVEIPVTLVR